MTWQGGSFCNGQPLPDAASRTEYDIWERSPLLHPATADSVKEAADAERFADEFLRPR